MAERGQIPARMLPAGLVLVAAHLAMLALAPAFDRSVALAERPILRLVGLDLFAGVAWLLAVWPPVRAALGLRGWAFLVGVGLALRLSMVASTPILEDDYWRYLWDGAVVAHGHSPYRHAPADLLASQDLVADPAPGLRALVREGDAVLRQVNHPWLRTIYPPVAQVAFALAHVLSPWSLMAWRLVLLLFDGATLGLLVLLLRRFRLPGAWAAVYWWCPLLVRETVNGAHMDALVFPFVLGALLAAAHGRVRWGVAILSLASGIKVWPVVLLPFLLRLLAGDRRRLVAALGLAAAVLVAAHAPALEGLGGANSGMVAYAEGWEINDAGFMALLFVVRLLLRGWGAAAQAPVVARGVAAALLVAWVAWLAWRRPASVESAGRRMLLAVAGLFLLSPAQFPWYGLWVLPLLALQPRLSLLVLLVLLSLYRLRFHSDARDCAHIFDYGIVWLQYLPVWALLAWEGLRGRASAALPPQTERTA